MVLEPHGLALRFVAAALPLWLLVWCWLWRWRDGEPIGAATALTLARGALVAALGGFLLLPRPTGALAWAPGALYALAAIADRYDGVIARRTGTVTRLGARLDVATDALGLLVAPLVGVLWGRLPWWYLALGAAYWTFRGALAVRAGLGLPVFPERLRPSPAARRFAGAQMALVAAALFPVLPAWLTAVGATVVMTPTLALFGREWLVATGRIVPPDLAGTG